MTAVVTETSVETRDVIALSQPKLAEICGSKVPNMMKSKDANNQAKKAMIVAFRVARRPTRRKELGVRLSGTADMAVPLHIGRNDRTRLNRLTESSAISLSGARRTPRVENDGACGHPAVA